MSKTQCDDSLPKVDHCVLALIESLAEVHFGAREATRESLLRIASRLTDEIRRASSHIHRQALPAWLGLMPDSEDVEAQSCRQAKHFTRGRLLGIIEAGLAPTRLLQPNCGAVDYQPAEGLSKLEQKLEAGGLSATTVNMATDFSSSALSLLLQWQNMLGEATALARYKHIRALVLRECASAHEAAKTDSAPFGAAMQNELRRRLLEQSQLNSSSLFSCTKEDLEGIAYELTKECKVWWSHRFPLRQ